MSELNLLSEAREAISSKNPITEEWLLAACHKIVGSEIDEKIIEASIGIFLFAINNDSTVHQAEQSIQQKDIQAVLELDDEIVPKVIDTAIKLGIISEDNNRYKVNKELTSILINVLTT